MRERTRMAKAGLVIAGVLLALPAAAQTTLGVGAGTGVQVLPSVGVGVGAGAGAGAQQAPPNATFDSNASGRSSIDAGRRHRGEADGNTAIGAGGRTGGNGVGAGVDAQQGLRLGIGR